MSRSARRGLSPPEHANSSQGPRTETSRRSGSRNRTRTTPAASPGRAGPPDPSKIQRTGSRPLPQRPAEARSPEGLAGRLTARRQGGRDPALPRARRLEDRHREAHGRVPDRALQLHDHQRTQAEPLTCIRAGMVSVPWHLRTSPPPCRPGMAGGAGHAIRIGKGDGNAVRSGAGAGDAFRNGEGARRREDVRHRGRERESQGTGKGTAVRDRHGDGAAFQSTSTDEPRTDEPAATGEP